MSLFAKQWSKILNSDIPWVTMGSRLDKLIVRWKYCKLKMHLINLTYWTSQLSMAKLNYAQSLQLGKISYHKTCFILKCWLSHVPYWTLLCKGETKWLPGCRMAVCISAFHPHDRRAAWHCTHCPAWHPGVREATCCQPRNRSKFAIPRTVSTECVYCFCTIVSFKNPKSSHCKSGTICIHIILVTQGFLGVFAQILDFTYLFLHKHFFWYH